MRTTATLRGGLAGLLGRGRLLGLVGTLALSVALGSLLVGHLLLIPSLTSDTTLIDPNLARALGEPLARRCGEVLLGACVLLAIVARPWTKQRVATSLGLIAAALAASDRLVLLPRVQQAWSRVDLVARRPAERLADAEQLQQMHDLLLGALLVVVVAIAALTSARREPPSTPSA